ncbi:glycosyltransferase family 9 protein [Caenispirillum salinarum]|uniref:glycosyltransferase family 9 protein n=1 Tax=Caenispirillum salinarum TaxID=859058 RepID=UPI00384D8651
MSTDMSRPRRLLFITSNQIGDAVLSTGVLNHLLVQEPDLRVTVVTGQVPAQLFEGLPNLDRLLTVRKRKRGGHWREIWKQTVTRRWWRVVDMRRSALPWLLWARHRHVLPKDRRVHRVAMNASLVGLQENPPPPRVCVRPEDEAAARKIIPDGKMVLGLGPTANWPGKTWPIAYWKDLVERLTGPGGAFDGASVALLGAPHEREAAAPLAAALGDRCLNLIGDAHLLVVQAVLGRCHLYIGNDSGLMHMAATAGVPTVGLFGPTDDRCYAPWSNHAVSVRTPETFKEWKDYMRRPDFDVATTGSLMESLTPTAVEAAVLDLLKREQRPRPPKTSAAPGLEL